MKGDGPAEWYQLVGPELVRFPGAGGYYADTMAFLGKLLGEVCHVKINATRISEVIYRNEAYIQRFVGGVVALDAPA